MKKFAAAAVVCLIAISLFGCQSARNGVTSYDGVGRSQSGALITETTGSADVMDGALFLGTRTQRSRAADDKGGVAGEPSYIRFYTPLGPMPLDWYGKYRILTDFQSF